MLITCRQAIKVTASLHQMYAHCTSKLKLKAQKFSLHYWALIIIIYIHKPFGFKYIQSTNCMLMVTIMFKYPISNVIVNLKTAT